MEFIAGMALGALAGVVVLGIIVTGLEKRVVALERSK